MSPTLQRDQACDFAKRDPKKALEKARAISDPWFRSQALAWVARYAEVGPIKIAREAAKAASECDDDYKRTAVRAWFIAALAERNHTAEAKRELWTAVSQSKKVTPLSSRAEALILLLQAAFQISVQDVRLVADELKSSCGRDLHWRSKRAVRDAWKLVEGELKPRPFFW